VQLPPRGHSALQGSRPAADGSYQHADIVEPDSSTGATATSAGPHKTGVGRCERIGRATLVRTRGSASSFATRSCFLTSNARAIAANCRRSPQDRRGPCATGQCSSDAVLDERQWGQPFGAAAVLLRGVRGA
jgi:hypothetical protein